MSPYENIVDAIHGLSVEEKSKLRSLLDEELKVETKIESGRSDRGKKIIGLLADEPELADQILESVMAARAARTRRVFGE